MTKAKAPTRTLNTQEAADYLGLHPRTVLDLVAQEQEYPGTGIVASNVARSSTPKGRRYRYQQAHLDRFLESRQAVA